MPANPPTHAQIRSATQVLHEWFSPTPVVRMHDIPIWYKLENTQPTGSFKVRGAWIAVNEAAKAGVKTVVTASAGNHGKGIAYAGAHFGVEVTIVVPAECPAVKLKAMREGAEVIVWHEPGYDAAEAGARRLADTREMPFISPFDDTLVMAGNGGTLLSEVAGQFPNLGSLVVPVGGGGLLAGILTALPMFYRHHVDVLAVQPDRSSAFVSSLEDDTVYTEWPPAETLAGGLEGGTGETGVRLARSYGVQTCRVSEAQIREAMLDLSDRRGLLRGPAGGGAAITTKGPADNHASGLTDAGPIEGSAAVVHAAWAAGHTAGLREPIVGILTGGNVSEETLRKLR